ncbi:MAG: helicase-related protein, partial [Candidatus Aenigmarchaeota archaeon]|nr:helicase-related protein [Candidatus Aenigmarchaeota archaeon]MDW8149486.1 helicase-related protein [Candidatus Aenigmarchaeota archaeon]
GKAYLFEKLAIVGSSNFTYAGLTSNTELNAVLDEAHCKYIKTEWFEKLWNESIDFKDELIRILDESKFGTKEYTPYQIFIKTLYELQKEDILFNLPVSEFLPESEVNLANFQEDAVRRIYSRLKTYNGVLIADSVGLGKTWIAKKIIEDFGFYRRQRFLIICPASVDATLWRPALRSIGVAEYIIHQEELGKEDFDFKELEQKLTFKIEDLSLIVLDESHNFRNPLSNRYENLFTLIEKASAKKPPKVLLLTATPMNNTYWDLYFQLMLIAHNNKRIFVKEGIFDLEKQFKKADKGDISSIADVLQIISIRRPRQYIVKNYPDAKYKDENGNWVKIEFPKRILKDVNYSLDKTYQGLYYKIAEKIENPNDEAKQQGLSLNLAYYRLEEYRVVGKKDEMELGRMKALAAILQTILLKRLESSVEAFRKSIQTQIDFLNVFKKIFINGKILRKEFYNKYLAYLDEETDESEVIKKLEQEKYLIPINLNEYDVKKFIDDLEKDIKVFTEIMTLISPIDKTRDAKLKELKNMLIQNCKNDKCIIFSFYSDTIDYLYDSLTEDQDFGKNFGKKILKVTGSFSTSQRKQIIEQFLDSDVDLLLSTDILSEGQNLQKARIVINYDLHWNPVRMIQRAGRIDRIGSPYKEIFIYNFYPEKELESLLELVKILQGKIEMINETIGLDASVLGEKINPKVFGIIRNLKGTQEQKEKTLQELEEEQFGGGEIFWQPLKEFGLEKLQEFCESIPYGVQSGLKKSIPGKEGFRGIFFYYKYAEDYHLWFLYDVINDKFINNKTEILNFISCKEEEARVIPQDLDVFEIHKKVLQEIEKFFSEGLIATQIRTAQGRMEKTIRDMRDELDYIKENYLDKEEPLQSIITKIIQDLTNISFTRKRMQILRRIWRNYQETKNWHGLIFQLQEFLKDKDINETIEIEKFDPEKLQLVCVDFIS